MTICADLQPAASRRNKSTGCPNLRSSGRVRCAESEPVTHAQSAPLVHASVAQTRPRPGCDRSEPVRVRLSAAAGLLKVTRGVARTALQPRADCCVTPRPPCGPAHRPLCLRSSDSQPDPPSITPTPSREPEPGPGLCADESRTWFRI